MKHARPDYDRIQDPAGLIPDDEPVFLLRAQDASAPEVLRFWADEHIRNGGDPALASIAESHADAMEQWQRLHGKKPADLPDSPDTLQTPALG